MEVGAYEEPGPIDTLQTGYPYIQASSQDKLQSVHPHTATCPTAPDLAS
jgi:hypothetical protein